MIVLVLLIAGVFLVSLGGGFALGWKARQIVPVRVPTNATRLDDAETDVKLAKLTLERREIGYHETAMDIRAGAVLDGMRRQIEQYDPVAVTPDRDGTDELLALLAAARRERGWTQRYLASVAGIRERRIPLIFGGGESPTVYELSRLAMVLELEFTPPTLQRPAPTLDELPELPLATDPPAAFT